jgi:hypothetical protein
VVFSGDHDLSCYETNFLLENMIASGRVFFNLRGGRK